MRNIYFLELCNLTPHLETSFELSLIHLNQGDKVKYYFLGHELIYKEGVFPSKFSWIFPKKILPEEKASKLISSPNFSYYSDYKFKKLELIEFSFSTLEELKEIRFKNFDLGLSVASSLISLKKDSNPSIENNYSLIVKMLKSSIQVYENALDILSSEKINLVYIFNGRFCNQKAIMRACESLNISFLIHERGANKNLFYRRPFMPHNKNMIQKEMLESWENIKDKNQAKQIALKWFEDRRKGVDTDWYSYSKMQEKNLVPSIKQGKKVISYFHSSDDEYAAIGDLFKWNGWKDQYDAVLNLIKVVDSNSNFHLILRLHPHMAKKSHSENLKWQSLSQFSNNIDIILPKSKIDSYALVEKSDVVISSGSKIGIEAVYLKKPSILLGPSPYDSLGLTYPANSILELNQLLEKNIEPINNDNLYKYAYWWATHGETFKYYKPDTLSSGMFMGVDLQKKPLILKLALTLKNSISRIVYGV
jgi:hypothetical protein